MYIGCGSTKGCFGSPTGCIETETCLLLATWQPDCQETVAPIKEVLQPFKRGKRDLEYLEYLEDKKDVDNQCNNSKADNPECNYSNNVDRGPNNDDKQRLSEEENES